MSLTETFVHNVKSITVQKWTSLNDYTLHKDIIIKARDGNIVLTLFKDKED